MTNQLAMQNEQPPLKTAPAGQLNRIVVIGPSGAGKTTLAARLSQHLNLKHVELDYLHWEPGWVEVSNEVFRARAAQALSEGCWIVDGNYSVLRDYTWGQADTLIWLDYSLPLVLVRLLRRTTARIIDGREICNGNRETARNLFQKDNLFWYTIKHYRRRRRDYPQLLQQPEYQKLRVVRLSNPQATRQWLSSLGVAF